MKSTLALELAMLFCLFVGLHAGYSSKAHAEDAGTCYTINDADARTYCLARARHDASVCYTIQRADLRAQCQAEMH